MLLRMKVLVREIPYKSAQCTMYLVGGGRKYAYRARQLSSALSISRVSRPICPAKLTSSLRIPKSELLGNTRTMRLDDFHAYENVLGDLLAAVTPRHKFKKPASHGRSGYLPAVSEELLHFFSQARPEQERGPDSGPQIFLLHAPLVCSRSTLFLTVPSVSGL